MTKDYTKGKIYILRSNLGDKVYIGSTISTLADRFYHHKTMYRKWVSNGKPEKLGKGQLTCVLVFEEYGIENVYIELFELYPCSCKDELERREGQIQREYIAKQLAVNKIIAGRSRKEYIEDNKSKISEYNKKYCKEYRISHTDYFKDYSKDYYNDNKERIIKRQKDYYLVNKDKISEYKSQKVKCECGCELARDSLVKHKKSKKHNELLKVKDI
jgi:hypothetical protein